MKEIDGFQPSQWQIFSSPSICSSCNEARDCYWCQQEQKCVHHTECCSFEDSNACCGASPQRERFSYSGECLSAKCLRGMLVYMCILGQFQLIFAHGESSNFNILQLDMHVLDALKYWWLFASEYSVGNIITQSSAQETRLFGIQTIITSLSQFQIRYVCSTVTNR